MENIKLLAFEYIISRLIAWYMDITQKDTETALKNFNKLKLFKLHFFVASVNSNTTQESDLLNTFDRFYALPYGPVEGYIYDHLNKLEHYQIYNDCISLKGNATGNFEQLDQPLRSLIDTSIENLRNQNEQLVTLQAFDLVEISHKWPVWKFLYTQAQRENRRNEFMPSQLIRISLKFFK